MKTKIQNPNNKNAGYRSGDQFRGKPGKRLIKVFVELYKETLLYDVLEKLSDGHSVVFDVPEGVNRVIVYNAAGDEIGRSKVGWGVANIKLE